MSFSWSYQSQGDSLPDWASFPRSNDNNYCYPYNDNHSYGTHNPYGGGMFSFMKGSHGFHYNSSRNCRESAYFRNYSQPHGSTNFKKRKFSENARESDGGCYFQPVVEYNAPSGPSNNYASVFTIEEPSTSAHSFAGGKRGRWDLQGDDEIALLSREEIENLSPSRKDGIDALHETRLRFSYCAFIQNLGLWLDLPQSTLGTAMVLCHRFFVRRSHACHDRFLIATAALFLAAKSEETPRPLNDVLKASFEILHKQNFTILSYMLPIDLFEQYRERIIEAEQLILTTLNFELNVEHPYDSLTSILDKLGLSQTHLGDLALTLISQGVHTRLDAHLMIFLAGGLIC